MAIVIDKGFFVDKKNYLDTINLVFNLVKETIKNETLRCTIVTRLFLDTNVDLEKEYTALLTIARCPVTWLMYERLRKEHLVHLAITVLTISQDTGCPRFPKTEGVSIPLLEPGEELSQILNDMRIFNALSWNTINILHDDTFDRDTISKVVRSVSDELPRQKIGISPRSIFTFNHGNSDWSRKKHIQDKLETFRTEQLGCCFLVIVTQDVVPDVMDVAKSLRLVSPDRQWLYVIPDNEIKNYTNLTYVNDLLTEGSNLAFLYNASDFNRDCNSGLINNLKEIVKALSRAVESAYLNEVALREKLTDEEFNIFRTTKVERQREIVRYLQAEISESDNCERCLKWRLSTAITWGDSFLHDGKRVGHLIDIGSWRPNLGLNLTDVLFPHVEHGFREMTLPIVSYHNPPWQIITMDKNGEANFGGLVFDVMKYLGKKLNFSYTVSFSSEVVIPKVSNLSDASLLNLEYTNGSLASTTRRVPSDVLTLVQEGRVLIGACAHTVNDNSKEVINFTIPIYIQTHSFLTARPRQLSRALLFASPFTKETWACLAAAIIIMGPILYVVHKYSPCSTKTSGLNSSWQCVWYVYGALLQQGGMYLPHSDSARLLIGIWWIIVMVLVATYSGSLVAFLTFPKMDTTIATIENLLARKNRLTWGFLNDSFLEEYLQNSNEKKYQLLLKRAERHNASQLVEVLKRVKDGEHVFIDWRTSLRFLMRSDLLASEGCYYSLSSDKFMDEPIAMLIAQDSPYLPIINTELHRMHESGLMNKWVSEKMPTKDKCWVPFGSNQAINKRKVNVADMQGIFFVLFMGVISSTFLLICEWYWHRRKVIKERKLIRPFVS
ncbi:ionotropic receptor 93a [Prorops nasuta]|uniref:ionotropic receptor 93a n=1 Tax=Prorops nasuta TaxID=863751 RepID=UPI0034CDE388